MGCFRNESIIMLARQLTLARYNGAVLKLAQPAAAVNVRLYTDKAKIPSTNMFWMKHQIEAKTNFNKHLNMERWVSLAALVSVCGSVAFPGYFLLDTVVATTFIAHGSGAVMLSFAITCHSL